MGDNNLFNMYPNVINLNPIGDDHPQLLSGQDGNHTRQAVLQAAEPVGDILDTLERLSPLPESPFMDDARNSTDDPEQRDPAPQDVRTRALPQGDHANEEEEGLSKFQYCSENHLNPASIITKNCEHSKIGPISHTVDRRKIVEESDPCKEVETTREVKRPCPVTKAVFPCDEPGIDLTHNFPYLPWENDSEQIHPWETEIGTFISLHLPFDSQR